MSRRALLWLSLLIAFRCLAAGQSPDAESARDVEVCQLLKDPNAYDEQRIRFRGNLDFEFEGDVIGDGSCHLPLLHRAIWWTYGGDSLLANQPDKKRIESLTKPIVKDAQYDEFRTRTVGRRLHRPDGSECSSHRECAYYEVTAAFTGTFFSGAWISGPGNTRRGSFGHMGCCHLFVIEQISDVVVKRTAVPSDEMAYACSSTDWRSDYPITATSTPDERAKLNRQFLAEQMRAHGDTELADSMDTGPSWRYLGLAGRVAYSSPDLLTSYTLRFPAGPKGKRSTNDTSTIPVAVISERCMVAAPSD